MRSDLILVIVGRLFAAIMALITMRVVTSFLSPEQYGELALLVTVQMFCGLFLINPIGQHINLHTHAWWDDGTLSARLRGFRAYVLVISLLGGVIIIALGKFDLKGQFIGTTFAMFAMVVAATWNATLIPILNMLGFRAASVFWSTITVVIGLASSILLVMWLQSAIAWFVGQVIGMTLGALGAKVILKRHGLQAKHDQLRLPLLDKNTIVTYCLPLAVATGLMWIQLSGYRFLIKAYWGFEQLGFLVIGLQIAGQIFSLAESLAMQFLYPLFYRRVTDHEKHIEVELAFSDLLNTLVPIYLVLAGFLILTAQYLLQILVAPQFKDSISFVFLGAGIELCRVLGNLVSNAAHVKRNTLTLALPYAVGSVIVLTLIYMASVLHMHIYYAALTLLLGGFVTLISILISMYRQIKFSLDCKRCLFGVFVMLAMTTLMLCAPKVSEVSLASGMLVLVMIPTAIILLLLVWKNPALHRLLNAQLRN